MNIGKPPETSATASTTSFPSSFTSANINNTSDDEMMNSNIIIRPYQEKDKDAVLVLFRRGMESLIPTFTRQMVRLPAFWCPVIGLAGLMHVGTANILKLFLSSKTRQSNSVEASTRLSSSFWLPWLASIGVVLLAVHRVHATGAEAIGSYIRHSIDSDLADISQHYACFLVAEDTSSGRIVGCVGGEKKVNDGEEKGLFELRRMSVDSQIQGRGLGRRLVYALEDKLRELGCRHLYLGTSSAQIAAHYLYQKTGFVLTKTTHPEGKTVPFFLRKAVTFSRYDKYYGESRHPAAS